MRKFNEQQIKLHDTSRLDDEVDKTQWLADLKNLKWYGPFECGENNYRFQTATDSGNFEGFLLDIWLDSDKEIHFRFLNKSSDSCGSKYIFNNTQPSK